MVNELIKVNQEEKVNVIDSREVAEMVEKEHSKLMRDIRRYCEYLAEANIGLGEYFIESSYLDANNQSRPCYLVTRKGCEICANKMTGAKGVIFTTKYVDRFNEMEKQLKNNVYSYMIDDPVERALKWAEEMKKSQMLLAQKDEVIEELSPLAELARKRIDKTGTISLTDVTKAMELKRGQITVWAKINGYIHKTIQEVNKKSEEYFKVVCSDGEHKGIAITEEGLRFIDKNIKEIKKCPCKMKKIDNK